MLASHDWTLELLALAVLAGVAAAYARGSATNARIADAVCARVAAALAREFAAVGAGAGDAAAPAVPGLWRVVSPSERELYATGRANAAGALATVRLKPGRTPWAPRWRAPSRGWGAGPAPARPAPPPTR